MSIENRDKNSSEQIQIINTNIPAIFNLNACFGEIISQPAEVMDAQVAIQASTTGRALTISILRFIPGQGQTLIPLGPGIDISSTNIYSSVGSMGYSIFPGLKVMEGDLFNAAVNGGQINGLIVSIVLKKLQDKVTYYRKNA